MPLSGTLNTLRAKGVGIAQTGCKFTFGATGAVSDADGTGYTTASLVRASEGLYTLTIPGTGSITLRSISLWLTEPTKNLDIRVRSYTESTRALVFEVQKAEAGATVVEVEDPTSGEVLYFSATCVQIN